MGGGMRLDPFIPIRSTLSPLTPRHRPMVRKWARHWHSLSRPIQPYAGDMSTMNISLPATLKAFVDAQVTERGYGTSSEYVRELIRRDQERLHLRGLLLAGAESREGPPADAAYFDGLRARVRDAAARRR